MLNAQSERLVESISLNKARDESLHIVCVEEIEVIISKLQSQEINIACECHSRVDGML